MRSTPTPGSSLRIARTTRALVAAMGLGELGNGHVGAMRADFSQQVDHRRPAQSGAGGDYHPDAGHEALGRSGSRYRFSTRSTAASALAGSHGVLRVASSSATPMS